MNYRRRRPNKQRLIWRSLFLLVFAVICSVFLVGCGGADRSRGDVNGDRIVATILGDPKTFNTLLITDATSSTILAFANNGMVGSDGITAEITPELAESLPEVSEDGLRYVFTLREGLKWSDGEPLTADDVVFTYNDLIFNEEIPTSSRDVMRIGQSQQLPKVEKLDQRRIAFTLPEKFAPFMRTVAGAEIMPKHILAPTLEKDADGKLKFLEMWKVNSPVSEIVGAGPYVLSDYRPGERVILKRNPYYWEQPKPYVDEFVFQQVSSADTALLRFRSGDLDIYGLRGEDFQLLKKEEDKRKFTIYNSGPNTGQTFVMFNLNKGRNPETGKPFVDPVRSKWFNEVKFRQAVAYAIDRDSMVTNIFRGLGEPQNSPISVPSPYFMSEAEGLKAYNYDPEKAKQLLGEAGFTYDGEGRLHDRDGNLVRFTLLTNADSNPVRGAIGSQIKNDLDQIGITVDFTGIDFNILISRLDNTKEWEAIILGFTGGVEPYSGRNLWAVDANIHMFNQGAKGDEPPIPGREIYDWERKIDNLLLSSAQVIDENERKQVLNEFQQTVQEYLPMIHLVVPYSLGAVRDRIEGIKYSPIASTATTKALWNIDELKIAE
jgi:peptide/nickel transport system substrate-binding protein